MARERPQGNLPDPDRRKPGGDTDDDLLSDSTLEELDLASLIGDDDSSRNGKNRHGGLVDDGELDLSEDHGPGPGSDLLEEEAGPVRPESLAGAENAPGRDLLESLPPEIAFEDEPIVLVEDDSPVDTGSATPALARESAGMEPLPAALVGAAGAVGAAGVAAIQGRESSAGHRGAAGRGTPSTGSADEGESGVEKKDNEGKAKKGWKRLGKGKGAAEPAAPAAEGETAADSRAAAFSAEEPAPRESKKSRGASKPGKAREAEVKESARPTTGSARGSVAFVCSECYEEFLLPANYSQEMVCCPECLHIGKRPDGDFLRTVSRHKGGEKRAFAMAIVSLALVLGLAIWLAWMASDPYAASGGKTDKNLLLGLLGGSALMTMIFVWLTVKAESNRWEVYF